MSAPEGQKSAPKAVVGYAGSVFPLELASAAGCDVRNLDAAEPESGHALVERWIDEKEGEWVRGIIAAAAAASAVQPGLDGIVITRAFEQAYYYLRELQRVGAVLLPTLHMFDLIPSSGASFALYNRRQTQDLFDLLARLAHAQPGGAELRQAIDATNARRARLRDLHDLRRTGAVSGTVAAHYILGGCAGEAPRPGEGPPAAGRTLLIVTGDALVDAGVHAAVEAAGYRVIAEDDGSGRFCPVPDIEAGDDPIDAIARHYAAIPTSRSQTRDMRFAFVRTILARGVDVVLCQVAQHDQLFGWDLPALKREAEDAGATFVAVRGTSPEAAVAALEAIG